MSLIKWILKSSDFQLKTEEGNLTTLPIPLCLERAIKKSQNQKKTPPKQNKSKQKNNQKTQHL